MSKKNYLPIVTLAILLPLCACQNAREQFDFSKKAPDEFAVVKRAPLALPSNFKVLPPPQPGAPRPQEETATDMARSAILGEEYTQEDKMASDSAPSQGENILLQKTGAGNVSPAIRAKVDEETKNLSKDKSDGIVALKKLVGKNTESTEELVDPVAETMRLKKNAAEGKPITEGETPVIKK